MSRRSQVLRALIGAEGAAVSGEDLAAELGVTRVAVSKHMAALRDLGYVIEAAPHTGYQLISSPDLLLPDAVEALVRDPLWVRFEGGPSTVSTNDDAKRLARSGAPEGTMVVVGAQTGGRGRLGREWVSPSGGVYLSIILRPSMSPAQSSALPLVVALGVARGLESLGCYPLLKWPNDVWLGTAPGSTDALGKLSGVLLEMQSEIDRVEWIVAGIGVNVSSATGRTPGAAYVDDQVPGCAPAAVAAAVLDGIAESFGQFVSDGFGTLAEEYVSRSMLEGREVTVRELDGTVRASGRVQGVDADGRLLLDGGSGMLAISTGDVTLRDAGA
ncbi:MAG: biotin--[acetyl-CoA-carboxylase] ligase [Actinomycetota bacterium]|nr:biotin--[acetyl-CoA-carboxylase] ligase [Actinomycetota bacterium]